MNIENLKNKLKKLPDYFKPMDLNGDEESELKIENYNVASIREAKGQETAERKIIWGGAAESNSQREKSIERRRIERGVVIGMAAIAVAAVLWGISYYSSHTRYTDYAVIAAVENTDIEGTQYETLGKSVIKYSADGVFCVSAQNEPKWSSAYSMQTPVSDICRNTMVIAEQQGTQVCVLNEKGVLGNFKTQLPIMKACVSAQGVTALLLKDGDVTWIGLYDSTGAELAKAKTTFEDSGYPLDICLSPNATRMMVSYLGVNEGRLNTHIAFYDFSSASDADEAHLTGSVDYPGQVFPEVYYADASTPVAVSDTGFVVFKNQKTPEEWKNVALDREILSCFHDENGIGFVFENEASDCRYMLEVYRYNGKQMAAQPFDASYSEARMEEGEILLYDAKSCAVYSMSGVLRFQADYEKQVDYFAKLSGNRKYLVITGDSMDSIRIV